MSGLKNEIKISVCIIAKDEEKMLADCLDSVKDASEEIILVDTGSTDDTIEIARQFGCKVYEKEWKDDFSEARNFAMTKASFPYILSIDADERLVNPEIIKPVIEKSSNETGGWLVKVISRAMRPDGGADIYSSNLLRLFKNDPRIRFSGIIHEQVLGSIQKLGLRIQNTPIEFLHLGYTHDKDSLRSKQLRNLRLLDKAIRDDPESSYNLYQRAKTYLSLDDHAKAEEDIQKALKYAEPKGTVKVGALNYGAVIAFRRQEYEKAIKRARKSLEIIPDQKFANFILGETYFHSKNNRKALEHYRSMQMVNDEKSTFAQLTGDYHLPDQHLYFRLGRSNVALKNYDKARKYFEKGLAIDPDDIGCLVGMSNIYFISKNLFKSKELLEKAHSLAPQRKDVQQFLHQVNNAIDKQNIGKNAEEKKKPEKIKPIEQKDAPFISLAMIVKNEEEMLPGCLESARDIADEIIIVDTGSSDKTKEIAKAAGAKVYEFEWIDDFSAARNESLKHCSGEWILYMDADERLLAPENLKNMLRNAKKDIGGYHVTIESSHLQLTGETEIHRGGYPRIFRNYGYPNIKFRGAVHEQITPSIIDMGKSIGFSDVIIKHLGYDRSREVMEKKIRRNYNMLIKQVKKEPLDAYSWYQLGQTLAQMKLFKEAESAIQFAVNTGGLSNSVYASAAATLSQMAGNKKNFKEARSWAERSLLKAPEQLYALYLKAFSQYYLENYNEAEKDFLEVLSRKKKQKGVPRSGFDIDIPESKILKGIEMTREKMR